MTSAPERAAPLGSVSVPVTVELVCAWATTTWKNANRTPARTAGRRSSLMVSSSPSRAGAEGCPDARIWRAQQGETPSVSWLGGVFPVIRDCSDRPIVSGYRQRRSVGATFPSCSAREFRARKTVVAPKEFRLTVARRRRLFTVFPCAESRVKVDGGERNSRDQNREVSPTPFAEAD